MVDAAGAAGERLADFSAPLWPHLMADTQRASVLATSLRLLHKPTGSYDISFRATTFAFKSAESSSSLEHVDNMGPLELCQTSDTHISCRTLHSASVTVNADVEKQ